MKRAAVLLVAVALAGCGGGDEETTRESFPAPGTTAPPATTPATGTTAAPATTAASADGVKTLDNVLALRSDFEADAGKTRVIVLLSPT